MMAPAHAASPMLEGSTGREVGLKTSAVEKLRRTLASDASAFGLWVTLESPSVTEMAVALGLDWVVIDAEHGNLDWKEITEHVRAAVRSDTVALVRVAELDRGLIKRALDVGADGVVIPWVETPEQLARAVAFARYPPEGVRGIGAERATGWGECLSEHAAQANEHVLVVPIIETVAAAAEVPRMCGVDGVEIFFFGPADFSASAGHRGSWEAPSVAEQILELKETLRRAGKHCGVVATGIVNLGERIDQGFRILALGLDGSLLLRSLHESLRAVGRDRSIRASLRVDEPPARLARPPEAMRPDRPEAMTPAGSGVSLEIEPAVRLDCHVGPQVQARGLTTGIVRFEGSATLSYHTHAFTESITPIGGRVAVDVEGRRYELESLDNVVVPPGRAHRVVNLAWDAPATVHVALASERPDRAFVDDAFEIRLMPANSAGVAGAERVNRFRLAARSIAGPGTSFIDCFNETLMPGVEMSGGYGLFQPGGRLPAHFHDFDESISIIEGEATCLVEGRRYTLRDSTAFVPRGRVHYFINDSDGPMAMIWVYAGPRPDRIVVDERNATPEGDPWREGGMR
jgi:2-keto-3-deoxy-L-rhamnonate aldolase RhmA/quercetin dioxygenase-like cupin family protein